MKPLAVIIASIFIAAVAVADDGVFKTDIINPTDQTLTVAVPARHSLTLKNFIQTGNGEITAPNTLPNRGIAYAMVGNDSAAIATASEEPKNVTIAGPAAFIVPAIGGTGTLFVTYRLAPNR